ncbi:putative chaperone protein DNAj [Leptomonas pyrrhocoris]|uniref:Putative chaperone protein DNAj n=1 Tax=Leptomonas pyrrhocoris TaxID=157538 RepID=A0A0M9G8M9_LEPPY|nr:putative chaperone protein DNAj [Leptomonas pyrrhocoris]KPA84933.1 putative chaperone protein DNAj [Leptomonas pyrrhocoris]|eukprot:XP_015663372.1 putative chaperone protein DNAj [Leptomonas pyrrhocoris]
MCAGSIYDLKGHSALYEVLGVPQTATQREIRLAYYRLAIVYHPDKNPGGGDVFKEVSFAHGILSDPEQRAMYDSGTLRGDIEKKARAYDPSMDPNVELSPETLRAFVDRVRQSHNANQQVQSAFEQRREEEMKRRAEYDARNPTFRAEYERARRMRQRGLGATAGSSAAPEVVAAKPRTSAEIVAELQRKEQEGAFSHKSVSASSSSGAQGGQFSYKKELMAQYRATHSEYEVGEDHSSNAKKSSLPFVRAQCEAPQYSETVDEKIQTYSNFDYRKYVEQGRWDGDEVEEAIMADALGQYDRNH